MAAAASGGNHDIKPNSVPAGSADAQSMQYQEIMRNLHALKPGEVTAAADSFRHLGDVLEEIRVSLARTATKMAPYWTGTAAQAAMDHFQRLHDQAAQLSAEAYTVANTTTWVGEDVMPKFQSIQDPQVMSKTEQDAIIGSAVGPPGLGTLAGAGLGAMGVGHDGTAKANDAARQYQVAFDKHMAQANAAMPSSLTTPPDSSIAGNQWNASGANAGSSTRRAGTGGVSTRGLASGGSGGYAGTGTNSPTGAAHARTAGLPSGNGDTTGSLAGYTPPPGGGALPPAAGGAAGSLPGAGSGGAGGFGGMGIPGGGFGGPGFGKGLGPAAEETMGSEGLGAASKAATAEESAAEEAAAAETATAEAAGAEAAGAESGMGTGMVPGMGGGGNEEKERQRRAWMDEDEDIWGVTQATGGPVLE